MLPCPHLVDRLAGDDPELQETAQGLAPDRLDNPCELGIGRSLRGLKVQPRSAKRTRAPFERSIRHDRVDMEVKIQSGPESLKKVDLSGASSTELTAIVE